MNITQAERAEGRENHNDSVVMYAGWLQGRTDNHPHRLWPRSRYAADLEAVGLPGNFFVAACLLGISEGTLRMRHRHGADLRMPLKCNPRRGRFEDMPLSIFSEELKATARVRSAPAPLNGEEENQTTDEELEGILRRLETEVSAGLQNGFQNRLQAKAKSFQCASRSRA